MNLSIKRVYDPASPDDGQRILVDRLWPRGLSREHAHVDLWLKTIAPSTELRKWFAHDPEKWPAFQEKYFAELAALPDEVEQIRALAKKQRVTLLYGARDHEHNQAVALLAYLKQHPG